MDQHMDHVVSKHMYLCKLPYNIWARDQWGSSPLSITWFRSLHIDAHLAIPLPHTTYSHNIKGGGMVEQKADPESQTLASSSAAYWIATLIFLVASKLAASPKSSMSLR